MDVNDNGNYWQYCQVGKVEPTEGGFWELGGWDETEMDNPWVYGDNPKLAPFDQHVSINIWNDIAPKNHHFSFIHAVLFGHELGRRWDCILSG